MIEVSDFLANIGKLSQHLWDYGADDVFTVLNYNEKNPGNVTQSNFTDILNLEKLCSVTCKNASKSNVWWHSVVEGDEDITVNENLRMSPLFFDNNAEIKLNLTIMDEIKKYMH